MILFLFRLNIQPG